MIKTYKVQLKPNNKQLTKLFQFAGASRFAYNWVLSKEMESLKNGNGFINDAALRKEFTKLKQLDEYHWLCDISNNVTKQAIKDCCNAFKRYFKLKKQSGYKPYTTNQLLHAKRINKLLTEYDKRGHPKYKTKRNHEDYGFYQDNFKIQITNTHVKLEKLSDSNKHNRQQLNWIRLTEYGKIPVNEHYHNPRIVYDGLKWWLTIGVETISNPITPETDGVGIDLGIKDLAICSHSNKYKSINNTKEIKRLKAKERRLQRSISRKYEMNDKGREYRKTNNVIKSEKALLKVKHRLTNIRTNYINQVVNDITNRKPKFVCIEDLNVKGMMSNKHLSKAVQEQRFYDFRLRLIYKCDTNEIPIVIANRFYPSSKLCCKCGNIKHDLKLKDRIYKCNVCGNVIDRDYQASLNLMQYGFDKLYA